MRRPEAETTPFDTRWIIGRNVHLAQGTGTGSALAAPPVVSEYYAAPLVITSAPVYDYAPGYTTATIISRGW